MYTPYTHLYYVQNITIPQQYTVQGHIFYYVPGLHNIRILTCGLETFKSGQSCTVLEKQKFRCINYGLFWHVVDSERISCLAGEPWTEGVVSVCFCASIVIP